MFLRLLLRRGKSRGLTPTARSPRVPSSPLRLGVCIGAEMKHHPMGCVCVCSSRRALLCKLLPLLPDTFKPRINLPFASPSWLSLLHLLHLKHRLPPDPAAGQLKSSVIQGCQSPRCVLGCTGCVSGCCSPGKALWSFAFVFRALVVLLLPTQRHWREDAVPFLLAALPFASPGT